MPVNSSHIRVNHHHHHHTQAVNVDYYKNVETVLYGTFWLLNVAVYWNHCGKPAVVVHGSIPNYPERNLGFGGKVTWNGVYAQRVEDDLLE